VRDGAVVKGVQFRNHRIVGDILELAERYCAEGADELVFYDITASPDSRMVDRDWVSNVARVLDIPFCVAGGIKSVADAEDVLNKGADKISINSPALADPGLISELAQRPVHRRPRQDDCRPTSHPKLGARGSGPRCW
jgi:cyclase